MRHQELRLQRGEAKRILGKFDELYDFIRNSGLHYKISENFGCSVITIGRNFHRYSDVYKDLRTAPASLETQASLNLNVVISELESTRREAGDLKEELQSKEAAFEEEILRKNKKIEDLENVQKGALRELEKVTNELFKVKEEQADTTKSNVNNILKITGLQYKLSEAEKVNSSKTQMIEELQAGTGNEEIAITRKKLSDLQEKMTEAEQKVKEKSELAKAANKVAKKFKKELSEMKKKTEEKETSALEKKLEEVTKKLEEETKDKEMCWKVMDYGVQKEDALQDEKVSLIKRLAVEVEKNDALEERFYNPSLASSTPIKQDHNEDSGLEHSLAEHRKMSATKGAVKWDLSANGLYLQHPTPNTGLVWGQNREPRKNQDFYDAEYANQVAACVSCYRRLIPSDRSPMGTFIPDLQDYHRFHLSNFISDCNAPWLHYGYCHYCLHKARVEDEHSVVKHANTCDGINYVYGGNVDAINSACKFYDVTENAILYGVDEHKAYNLIRKLHSDPSECLDVDGNFFVPHTAYSRALWKLKDCDHEGSEHMTEKHEDNETSATLEERDFLENEEKIEIAPVLEEASYYTIGEYSTAEEKFLEESEGVTSEPPDDEANYTQLGVETESEASESEGEASETSEEDALPPCYSKYQ